MSPALALISCWVAYYAALGLFFPFLTIYLTGTLGMEPRQATAVFAVMPAMTLLVPPFVGLLADAERARVYLLRGCACLAALGFLAFAGPTPPLTTGAAVLLGMGFLVFCATRAPLTSMLDAVGFEVAEHTGSHFGRLRLWGSFAFALAVWGSGLAIDRVGVSGLLHAALVAFILLSVGSFFLPAPARLRQPDLLGTWLRLLSDRRARILLATVVVGHIAGSAYDGCYSMHVVALGYGKRQAGILWAVGVFAEIVLLYASDRIARRIGEGRLLVAALAVAALRWVAIAFATTLPLLYLAQPLHGISFGLFYVAAARSMRQLAPSLPTASQGLMSAAFGLGGVVGMLVSGRLFEAGGGRLVFLVGAGLASFAALLATGFVVDVRALADESKPQAP